MKKKIPTDILIQIEEQTEEFRKTNVFRYTQIKNYKNRYNEQYKEVVDNDMVARAIDLAHIMPYGEIKEAIDRYDNASPRMNADTFVWELSQKYHVKKSDVIDRIQYVRRIVKRQKEEETKMQDKYKQVIVVNKELNMSKGKMAAQVSHASMAFLTKMIQNHTIRVEENRYRAWEDEEMTMPQLYKRDDLYVWAKEARERGEMYFYARPVDPNNKYGKLELCEPSHSYMTVMNIDAKLYEDWMGGIFTKVILEAKNEKQMQKIVDKAIEVGMIEGIDFFCIRDACLTELTPDETGTRWTCIGFTPTSSSRIDPVTKKLQLFKG